MNMPVRVLIAEHIVADAELAKLAIRQSRNDCEFHVIETCQELPCALETFQPDVIVVDEELPDSEGVTALQSARKHAPLTPIVVWADSVSVEAAVECIKAGASNYVHKRNHTQLVSAVLRASEEREALLKPRAVEDTLPKSQTNDQTLVTTSHDLIWSIDANGCFTSVNDAARDIYGYEPGDLLGRSFSEFLDAQYEDQGLGTVREAIARSDQFRGIETHVRHCDGTPFVLTTNAIVLRDDRGHVTGLTGNSHDITIHKRQRKQVEVERQVLLEIMQGLAATKDLQELMKLIHHSIGKAIYAENFFVVLYQPTTGLFEEIYYVDQYDLPEPPSKLEKSITAYVFRTGQALLLTQEMFDQLAAQGEVELVGTNSASWLGVPLKTTGRTIGVMAVQDYDLPNRYTRRDRDFLASIAAQVALAIERKQADEALVKAESKYRMLVERLPVVVYTAELGIDGTWFYVSPQIENMLGFTAEEWMADSGLWYRQIHPEDRDQQQVLEEQADPQNAPLIDEYRMFTRDGRQIWVQDSAYILPPDGNGTPIAQGILMDLTERKRSEEEIRRQTEARILLYETTQDLVMERDLSKLLHIIVERATRLLNAHGGGLYLCEPQHRRVRCVVSYNTSRDFTGLLLNYGEGAAGRVAEIGEPLIIDDYSSWTGRAQAYDQDSLFNAVLSVPIKWQNEVIGVLHALAYGNERRFTQADLSLIISFANQAAIAIQNARLYSISQQELMERKRAEIALRESEERFMSAFEHAAIGMALLTPEGRWFRVNRALCDLIGYSEVELLQQTFQDVTHPDDLGNSLNYVGRLLGGEINSFQMEKRYIHKQGWILWILLSVSLLRDDQGKPLYFIAQLQDISERKRVEAAEREQRALAEALRDTAETLSSTLDYGEVLDHILVTARQVVPHDAATIMLLEDQAAHVVRLQGYTRYDLDSEIRGLKLPLAETTNLREMLATRQPVVIYDTHTYPGWHKVKGTEWLRSSVGTPISIYGEVIGFICLDAEQPGFFTPVHADRLQAFANQAALAMHNARLLQQAQVEIAERIQAEKELRASEERFLQLANNIQEVFWMTDANTGREIYMSPAAEAIWGRTIENLMQEPDSFINSVFPEDRPLVLRALEGEKRGEKAELEYRIVRPNGSLRWIWDRAFPIWDHSGRVVRIAGISADITERRESEQALVKSQTRYRQLFDSSPISIFEKDFSAVKHQIELLRKDGVTSFKEYFSSHPDRVSELAALVKVTDANQTALDLYGVEHKDSILKGLTQILSAEALKHFQDELLGLMSPSKRFVWEGTDRTLSGAEMEVIVSGSIPQGSEEDWSKVIVSVSDISERKSAEEEMRRRAEETAALLETSQALTNLDLQVTLQTISNSAKNLFEADGCRIFLMEPDGETLRCVLTLQENFAPFSDLRIKVGQGVTGAVAASGRPEIVNQMQNDPRAVQVPGTAEKEEEAIMFAPLKERDHTIGVLSIRRVGDERGFRPSDLGLLEAFAAMAASAVSNARLFEETQRRLAELEALYENGLAVGRLLEPHRIGERVIQTFARYLRWHHVTIRLRRGDSDELELVAINLPDLQEHERSHAEQNFTSMVNQVGQGLSGLAIQTGASIRTGNVHAHPQYINTQEGIQSGLYMPLKAGERVIGVISVESELPNAFDEADERLLATLASQAAIAFENARLYQAIQKELLERRRAEEAVRLSEAHYRELADSITDILFELDQHMHCTHWNKASEVLTGIPVSYAIGKSIRDIFGDSQEQSRVEKIYEDVLRNRQPRTFETLLEMHGTRRSFEINAYPSRRGVSVVAKDVTDRKRSESIMQKRFELMEYSAHHSLQELIQRIVDEVSELTGSSIGFLHFVEEDQNSLGMQIFSTNTLRLFGKLVGEEAHLALDRAGIWAEAVRQRRPLIQNDYRSLISKKGLPHDHLPLLREIVIPIIRNEKLVAVLGIGNKPQEYTQYDLEIAARLADYAWDIIERKQMEEALAVERNQLARRVEERTADLSRANSNLARALRVKDEFLANMSHELRTPLNAILGLSESLGEQIAGPLNEKQQKYITTISESGHHLLALINDILDLAKIEAGQITLDINKVDIHSVCQASLRMIKQLAQKKNQNVALSIENGLGLMWADERRLKQMIVNLLGNAVKFTPENGQIGLQVQGDEEANKITITVWDNGIGIKEQDLARLFQPFVQLDSGLARETTGTGLGLALVAQMARLHGGSVNASSQPGVGSRFSIVLPWEPALALDSVTRMRITGKFHAIKFDEQNKPTILLVEDTKEVIMMIQDYLELAGYRIVTAQDGLDAIVQAKLVHPDLILMDVQMPRLDGLEATRRLRAEPEFQHTPIIALTALAMPNDRERCLAAGMDEYMSKPINLKALVKIIQSCLFSAREPRPE